MPLIRRSNLGRKTRNTTNQGNYRSNQSDDRNERERIRISQTRETQARHSTNNRASLNRAAFSYDVSIDYSNYQCVVIGSMNSVCSHQGDGSVRENFLPRQDEYSDGEVIHKYVSLGRSLYSATNQNFYSRQRKSLDKF